MRIALKFLKSKTILAIVSLLFFQIILLPLSVKSTPVEKNSNASKNIFLYQPKEEFFRNYSNSKYITLPSPFGFDFVVFTNPDDFCIAGFSNSKLIFYYTNSKHFNGIYQIKIGSNTYDTKYIKKSPITKYIFKKGNITYTISDQLLGKDYDVFDIAGKYYLFVFYDRLAKPNTINGIFMVDKKLWSGFLLNDSPFSNQKGTVSLEQSFENMAFYHLNAIRKSLQKSPFEYSYKAVLSARSHSQDMNKYNFFAHTDIFGKDPSDRMKEQGIVFKTAAENIAMGTKLMPFFANHILLNSEGHRKNIEGDFEYVGVGVSIDKAKNNVYYTQNFYKP